MEQIEKQVLELAGEMLGGKATGLDTPLLGAGSMMDSLLLANLVLAVEERFGVSFEDDLELEFLETVESLAQGVDRRLRETETTPQPAE